MIDFMQGKGLIKGFRVDKDNIQVSILQFADDMFLFCKFYDSMFNVLTQTLALFKKCAKLKVYWEKSVDDLKLS